MDRKDKLILLCAVIMVISLILMGIYVGVGCTEGVIVLAIVETISVITIVTKLIK